MESENPSVAQEYEPANKYSIVFATVPDESIAQELAQSIILQKLAAVVNILPAIKNIRASKKHQVKTENRVMMVIKSPTHKVERLIIFLTLNSPVDIEKSDITSTLIHNGNAAFFNWMREITKSDPHSDDETSMEQTKTSVSASE